MDIIIGESLQETLRKVLLRVMYDGEEVVVRGNKTKELHPCFVEIENPRLRTLLYPKRGNNPFHSLAETMWILAGRNDMEFLEKFLPRAKEWSDDGEVWRAGYGKRLRKATGVRDKINNCQGDDQCDCVFIDEVDQIEYVYELLKEDPTSRQAIMTIWDPAKECNVKDSVDYPCNNWIHFMIRNGRLDCEVAVRSNDAVWGYSSVNVYEWTVLQEILANMLNVEVGKLFYYTSSMHIYEKHYAKAASLIKTYAELPELPVFGFNIGKNSFDKYFGEVERLVKCVNDFEYGTMESLHFIGEEFEEIHNLLIAYLIFEKDKDNVLVNEYLLPSIPFSDLKVACVWWMMKKEAGKDVPINVAIEKTRTLTF